MTDVTVTADDVLRSQTFSEIEAARLATRYCTYSRASVCFSKYGVKGITQSIYSCRTCSSNDASFVGVCEPCMLTCHADHDVFELGLRRDFRCDCATVTRVSSASTPCQAQPLGMPTSGLPDNSNIYLPLKNWLQNKFCSCSGHYDESSDKMIQCAACDDWFHDTCISGYFDTQGEESAFICPDCTKKFPYFSQWSTTQVGETNICSAFGRKGLESKSLVITSPQDKNYPPSPGLDQSVTASEHFFQPWVCCLTCTQGADDGRGVCLACANECHAGHVLTRPRITQFACDCVELSSKVTSHILSSSVPAASATELPASTASTTTCKIISPPLLSSRKRMRSELGDSNEGGDARTSSLSLIATTKWCSSTLINDDSSKGHATFTSAGIFADSLESIVSALCQCSACCSLYAKDRLSSWFHEDEQDIVAPDCEQWLSRNVLTDVDNTSTLINSVAGTTSLPTLSTSPSSTLLPPPGFSSLHDQGLVALSHMPHVQQQTALLAYTNLTGELMPFLRSFAESGKVVTASDIRLFFQELKSKRRGVE